MVISAIADQVVRTVEGVTDTITAPFSEPVIRLGVTGLSRAGKTVFITSLVANLMNRGRMPQLRKVQNIQAAFLQPQPDDTIPRFEYESHLGKMTSQNPSWPEGTRHVSELRLSLRVQPTGLLSGLTGPKTVHLDIVDYPGEWLLDLALLDQSFSDWSKNALEKTSKRESGADYLQALADTDPNDPLDETVAQSLASKYTEHLQTARSEGYSDCSPGRFLLPGDMAGSPVLTFSPLPSGTYQRKSLGREFERRFQSYKRNVVRPFF
ncbi:MAG: YcjX family protein, partial [Pseudomonadota bacterium]